MHDFESQVFQTEKCSTVKFSFKALIIPKTQLMWFSCVVGSLANKDFQPIKTKSYGIDKKDSILLLQNFPNWTISSFYTNIPMIQQTKIPNSEKKSNIWNC